MEWLAGTSGYSYKEWKGSFYPEKISADAMLGWYASQLPAVEINNTFYRMPASRTLETWRDAVPEHFRFAIKAPRSISHKARLRDCQDATSYLADRVRTLGDKLGCVLFQLPPYMRKDAELLDAFLGTWSKELCVALEFRHRSWFDEEVAETLGRHDAAICVSEDGKLDLPTFFATTDWTYFRLRKQDYDDAALALWRTRGEEAGAGRGLAFFKHEDEGAGPALARRFLGVEAVGAVGAEGASPC